MFRPHVWIWVETSSRIGNTTSTSGTATTGPTAMCPSGADYTGAPMLTGTITGREGTQTVIIHGMVEGDRHMVVDDGIIMEVVLVTDHGVLMVLGALMEV